MEVGTPKVTLDPILVVISAILPPFILYRKVYGKVPFAPVNVIMGLEAFRHTEVVPEMTAVGN